MLNSWCILSIFYYLFHKLFEEKPWKSKKMSHYAFYVLLNSIVQENSDQDMNQWKKKTKRGAKGFVARATKFCLARYRPSNKCRHGGNGETESMFLAIKVHQSDKCRHCENFLPDEIWRFRASGWWRGRNPLAKKGPVAIATKSCLARK